LVTSFYKEVHSNVTKCDKTEKVNFTLKFRDVIYGQPLSNLSKSVI